MRENSVRENNVQENNVRENNVRENNIALRLPMKRCSFGEQMQPKNSHCGLQNKTLERVEFHSFSSSYLYSEVLKEKNCSDMFEAMASKLMLKERITIMAEMCYIMVEMVIGETMNNFSDLH